jgi:hypothetical protein
MASRHDVSTLIGSALRYRPVGLYQRQERTVKLSRRLVVVEAMASQWVNLNYGRAALVLAGSLAALKAFSLPK